MKDAVLQQIRPLLLSLAGMALVVLVWCLVRGTIIPGLPSPWSLVGMACLVLLWTIVSAIIAPQLPSLLPLVGIACVVLLWAIISATVATDLPSPDKTWEVSKLYVLQPFEKRGELDQGVLRFAWYSLILVAQGFSMGLALGIPIGLLHGLSAIFRRMFDPLFQIIRPVSPLAWYPLGLVLFQNPRPAALFTIAMCSMWPTVLNTSLGIRSIPQDYLNVARVLQLSPTNRLFKILIPATLPYLFTGFRLSLGLAWLVIVAVEMLSGTPGIGSFLSQEYYSLVYGHIITCIITIGVIGFALDRLMSMVERRFKVA